MKESKTSAQVIDLTANYRRAVIFALLLTTVAGHFARYFHIPYVMISYLLSIGIVTIRLGQGPGRLAFLIGLLMSAILFVPPYRTFAISDLQYFLIFCILLTVELLISFISSQTDRASAEIMANQRRVDTLYSISKEALTQADIKTLFAVFSKHLQDLFVTRLLLYLSSQDSKLELVYDSNEDLGTVVPNQALANMEDMLERTLEQEHSQLIPNGWLLIPLLSSNMKLGVLAIAPNGTSRSKYSQEQIRFLETFAGQIAFSIERSLLFTQAQNARMQIETEQFRNSLLSAVSHDFRTPLASILGAASVLAEKQDSQFSAREKELATAIFDEAQRLNKLLTNILDLTRLEAGTLSLRTQWHSIEEIIGAALHQIRHRVGQRQVNLNLPEQFSLIKIDGLLIEQVLINLLENALKYSPADSEIIVEVHTSDHAMTVQVEDQGFGIDGEEELIFDKFYRGRQSVGKAGHGLGLSLSAAIINAHGGNIQAHSTESGGARFTFTIPITENPPDLSVIQEADDSLEAEHKVGQK